MKKRITIAVLVICLVAFCIFNQTRILTWAGDAVLKIFINGAASNLKPIVSEDMYFVPLSFPVEEGMQSWQVSVDYDKTTGKVNIKKLRLRAKQREKTTCPRCIGSTKCQACYPAGSGRTCTDYPCPVCDGTGKCFYCDGNGEY